MTKHEINKARLELARAITWREQAVRSKTQHLIDLAQLRVLEAEYTQEATDD